MSKEDWQKLVTRMMNRYAIVLSNFERYELDKALENIKRLGGHVVSVSCSKNGYMIMYKAEEEISEEDILK